MVKVVFIISGIYSKLAFDWLVDHLIDSGKFNIQFILINDNEGPFESFLKERKISFTRIPSLSLKSTLKQSLVLYRLLKKSAPAIVHCHQFDATLAGMIAAKLAGITDREFY